MPLINIEYGSLASSDTMNQNFSFLDDKITDVSTEVDENLATIVANVSNINSQLNEITSEINNVSRDLFSQIEALKYNVQNALNTIVIFPNWNARFEISDLTEYEALQNGFLMLALKTNTSGKLLINSREVEGVTTAGNTMILPIKKGDIISSTLTFDVCCFIPTSGVVLD